MNQLNILYEELDFKSGLLYPVMDAPSSFANNIDWLEKGEWFAAAKRAGAEKIFFVQNNPVAVFAECGKGQLEKVKAFNRAWCLGHPRLLFLASPGEITVYDLTQKPADENKEEDWKELKSLDVLKNLNEVSQRLQDYHRDNIETGRLFADKRFGDLKNRADNSLIRDLKTVRQELIHAGLDGKNVRFAHALIGRAIFIRYLEDRLILTEDYFRNIARKNAAWTDLLLNPKHRNRLDFSRHNTFFPRVLADKGFTYELFRSLSVDFNGDMFPGVEEEELVITQEHLTLIQDLLYGDMGVQKKLFFYSYRFDIVPLDLISSIYEEFYHTPGKSRKKADKKRQDGAYYTPPILVDFILSRVLTTEVLDKSPRILDPACGSGIFLVEAFRRIVRYEWYKNNQAPTFEMLKRILKKQIAGIEVNEEAARITAFSLYLSMLHYLDPPAISRQLELGNKLPNLIACETLSDNHFHCILPGNAFDTELIESNPRWSELFGAGCANIVVGNPPWGSSGKDADDETKIRHKQMVDWCEANNKPIGDKETSQAFLWRSLDFLEKNGKAAILVSAGVLFKHNTTTQAFRNQWLNQVKLVEVFNFIHVRKFFFKGADSPFLSIRFEKSPQEDKSLHYWTVKQSKIIEKTQSILLSRYDMHILLADDLAASTIWKELWFGRKADTELLRFLGKNNRLLRFSNRDMCGRGYEVVSGNKSAEALKPFKSIDIESFSRYSPLKFSDPPLKVYRLGSISVYENMRLLIQRGIREQGIDKGRIIARFETAPFCFTNALHGVKLEPADVWRYKIALGTLWSSLARYYFFMTSSNWGLWHHEIHLDDELLQLPVVLDKSNPVTDKIISIVDKLRNYQPSERDIFNPEGVSVKELEKKRFQLETELDEAIFELFGLNEEEKDLIRDFCEVTLPFFYNPFESTASMPAVNQNDYSWIEKYVHVFCKRWSLYLGKDEEMRAEIHVGSHGNMVAVDFFPSDKGDPWDLKPRNDKWGYILEQIGKNLPQPMGSSQIIMDGVAHVVSDNGIIIIKRNEKRFWTQSMAREDADAGICKRMMQAIPEEGKQP